MPHLWFLCIQNQPAVLICSPSVTVYTLNAFQEYYTYKLLMKQP